MPQLFKITDEWNEQPWFSTGGTRAKKYFQAPNGKYYYFKQSQLKPGKDYRYEFWSEIIASEVGKLLEFNMLQYDIAVFGDVIGCISESMINLEEERLEEGLKYIQAFSPIYDPTDKSHQKLYTFQMIENSLENAKLKKYIEQIVEIIVFDALIGNGDRHQENWAIIKKQRLIYEAIEELENSGQINKIGRVLRWLLKWEKRNVKKLHEKFSEKGKKLPKSLYIIEERFSPIYDSGSSLGRELLDDRVELLLKSEQELNRYIIRGLAEIHWVGKKVSHFDLIRHLLDSQYKETTVTIINRILKKWDGLKIESIINTIDQLVPESHGTYKIPDNRKQLIIKIITLRCYHLESLLNERV